MPSSSLSSDVARTRGCTMDYEDIRALEAYALAASAEERDALAAAAAPGAVTQGQLYLLGVHHAIQKQDAEGAKVFLESIKAAYPHSDLTRRLEALVVLAAWPRDPAATAAWLQRELPLSGGGMQLPMSFEHAPPAAAMEAGAAEPDGAAGDSSQPGGADATAQQRHSKPQLTSHVPAEAVSAAAFLAAACYENCDFITSLAEDGSGNTTATGGAAATAADSGDDESGDDDDEDNGQGDKAQLLRLGVLSPEGLRALALAAAASGGSDQGSQRGQGQGGGGSLAERRVGQLQLSFEERYQLLESYPGSCGAAAGLPQALAHFKEALTTADSPWHLDSHLANLTMVQLYDLAASVPQLYRTPRWQAAVVRKMYAAHRTNAAALDGGQSLPGGDTTPQERMVGMARQERRMLLEAVLRWCSELKGIIAGGGPAGATGSSSTTGPAGTTGFLKGLMAGVSCMSGSTADGSPVDPASASAAAAASSKDDGDVPAELRWIQSRAQLALTRLLLKEAEWATAPLARPAGGHAQAAPSSGGANSSVVVDAAVDAVGRALRMLVALGPGAQLAGTMAPAVLQAHAAANFPHNEQHNELGDCLPHLPQPYEIPGVARELVLRALRISPVPKALLQPGGVLAGLLEPSLEQRLLAEVMLTRHHAESSSTGEGAASGGAAGAGGWAAAYSSGRHGSDLQELVSRVELNIEDNGGSALDGVPELLLTAKALQQHSNAGGVGGATGVTLRLFELQLPQLYKATNAEVSISIDLEGITPTWSWEIDLAAAAAAETAAGGASSGGVLPPLVRVCARVALPQLKGRRGVWVAEVLGGGLVCRALIRRGALVAVERRSPAGQAMTLYYEDGTLAANPRVLLDGKEYASAAGSGEVLLPFAPSERYSAMAILVADESAASAPAAADATTGAAGSTAAPLAALWRFTHMQEAYTFSCGMCLELESASGGVVQQQQGGQGAAAALAKGSGNATSGSFRPAVLLTPRLEVSGANAGTSGWSAPLQLLKDVTLTITTEVMQPAGGDGGDVGMSGGGTSSYTVHDLDLGDGSQAVVHALRLPERCARVSVRLTARLQLVAPAPGGGPAYQDISTEQSWSMASTAAAVDNVRDAHLLPVALKDGTPGWAVAVRGRAGEPCPGVPVAVAMMHRYSRGDEVPPSATAGLLAPYGIGGGQGAGGDAPAAADNTMLHECLVLRGVFVTDDQGLVVLGALPGIKCVATQLPPMSSAPSAPGSRYCWPLPERGGVTPPSRINTIGGPDMKVVVPYSQHSTVQQAGVLLLKLAVAGTCLAGHGYGAPEVAEDCTEGHVNIQGGAIAICGLSPGLYRLCIPATDTCTTIHVFAARQVGPAVPTTTSTPTAPSEGHQEARALTHALLSSEGGVLAPLSPSNPLRVVSLSASRRRGIRLQLAGAAEATGGGGAVAVHLVMSRLATPAQCRPSISRALMVDSWRHCEEAGQHLTHLDLGLAPRWSCQSGRRLGDEVRYVLDRRTAEAEGRVQALPAKLDRPSLLVHPVKVRETSTRVQAARGGERFHDAAPMMAAKKMMMSPQFGAAPSGGGPYAYGFGAAPAAMMAMRARCSELECGYAVMDECRLGGFSGAMPVPPQEVGDVALSWCPPALVLSNIEVGANGLLELTPEALAAAAMKAGYPAFAAGCSASGEPLYYDPWAAGHGLVRVVAVGGGDATPGSASWCSAWAPLIDEDGNTAADGTKGSVAVSRSASLSGPVAGSALLQRPFAGGSPCVETRSCKALQAGEDVVIADAATTKLQLYSSVPKAWSLLGCLLQHQESSDTWRPQSLRPGAGPGAALWAPLQFIQTWPTLSMEAKRAKLFNAGAAVACREVYLLLALKDAKAFQALVRPLLATRLPSTMACMDAWMVRTAADLEPSTLVAPAADVDAFIAEWTKPHRYAKLTPMEKVLLALEQDVLQLAKGQFSASSGGSCRLARLAADLRTAARWSVSQGGAVAVQTLRDRFETVLRGPDGGDDEAEALMAAAAEDVGKGGRGSDDDDSDGGGDNSSGGDTEGYVDVKPFPPQQEASGLFGGPPAPKPAAPMMAMAMMAAPAPPPPPPGAAQRRAFAAVGAADMAAREVQRQAPVYRAPEASQEWEETGWYRMTSVQLRAAGGEGKLSPVSEVWADLAEHLASALEAVATAAAAAVGGATDAVQVLGGGAAMLRAAASGGGKVQCVPLQASAASSPTEVSVPAFLPSHVEHGAWTLTDALLLLAVLGLPWTSTPPVAISAGLWLTLTATTPMLVYAKQLMADMGSSRQAGGGTAGAVVLMQRLVDVEAAREKQEEARTRGGDSDAADDDDEESGDGASGSNGVVQGDTPLVRGRLYSYQVYVTNNSDKQQSLDITLQAPQGSLPLGGVPALWTCPLRVPPYSTRPLTMHFYFPKASGGIATEGALTTVAAFPATAARRGRVMAVAQAPSQLQVASQPPARAPLTATSGTISWRQACEAPANEEGDRMKIQYLATGDLSTADLSRCLWRCRQSKAFWTAAMDALRSRGVYDAPIWSYGVHHRDTLAVQELVTACVASSTAVQQLIPEGTILPPLLPTTAQQYKHHEYWPLVNARAHALGDSGSGGIMNEGLQQQWNTLLTRMAHTPTAAAGTSGGGTSPAASGGSGAAACIGPMEAIATATLLASQDRLYESYALLERATTGLQQPGPQTPSTTGMICSMQADYLRAWLMLAGVSSASPSATNAAAAGSESAAELQASATALRARYCDATKQQEGCCPDPKWRARFVALVDAMEEVAAAERGTVRTYGALPSPSALAASFAEAPSDAVPGGPRPLTLMLKPVPGGDGSDEMAMQLDVSGAKRVCLSFYPLDLEMLFSMQPFVIADISNTSTTGSTKVSPGDQRSMGSMAFVRPQHSVDIIIPAQVREMVLPAGVRFTPGFGDATTPAGSGVAEGLVRLQVSIRGLAAQTPTTEAGQPHQSSMAAATTVLVEASAGGVSKTLLVNRCGLEVRALEHEGVVAVTAVDTGLPVQHAYVKVYVRYKSGATAFHKDGYTDRRGRFDYWALTSPPPEPTAEVALIVAHPRHGCTTAKLQPPPH